MNRGTLAVIRLSRCGFVVTPVSSGRCLAPAVLLRRGPVSAARQLMPDLALITLFKQDPARVAR